MAITEAERQVQYLVALGATARIKAQGMTDAVVMSIYEGGFAILDHTSAETIREFATTDDLVEYVNAVEEAARKEREVNDIAGDEAMRFDRINI